MCYIPHRSPDLSFDADFESSHYTTFPVSLTSSLLSSNILPLKKYLVRLIDQLNNRKSFKEGLNVLSTDGVTRPQHDPSLKTSALTTYQSVWQECIDILFMLVPWHIDWAVLNLYLFSDAIRTRNPTRLPWWHYHSIQPNVLRFSPNADHLFSACVRGTAQSKCLPAVCKWRRTRSCSINRRESFNLI